MRIREDLELAWGSVKGPVRPENQDDILVWEPVDEREFRRCGRLLAIADGMGGLAGGAEASRTALRAMLAGWLDAIATQAAEAPPDPGACLEAAFARACVAVARAAAAHPELAGMGTTLTAVALRGDRVEGVHVGDTRCVLIGPQRLEVLSELHVDPAVDHVLTRAVGAGQDLVDPDRFSARLAVGESLVLSSDGFWHPVPDEECQAMLVGGVTEAVHELLRAAQRRDGQDNASLLIARRRAEAEPGAPGREVEEVDAALRPWDDAALGIPSAWIRQWPWILAALGLVLGVLGAWRFGLA
ncbi:MAG: PP2C family serine/threonine-protein phosphatase [Planctomycetota bacterium]